MPMGGLTHPTEGDCAIIWYSPNFVIKLAHKNNKLEEFIRIEHPGKTLEQWLDEHSEEELEKKAFGSPHGPLDYAKWLLTDEFGKPIQTPEEIVEKVETYKKAKLT